MALLRNAIGDMLFEQIRPVLEAGDYDQLVEKSVELAQKVASDAESKYALGDYERWDFSQDTGELVLSANDGPRIAARVQVIGTYSFDTGTWLWAWANASFDESLTHDSRQVRTLGSSKGFQELMNGTFKAEEDDCWALAAVSLAVCGGHALYSGATDRRRTFFLLKEIRAITPESPA